MKINTILVRFVISFLLIFSAQIIYASNPHVWAAKGQLRKNKTYPRKLVLRAQKALLKKGFKPGVPDGIWGSLTANALAKFQKREKLEITRELDYKTMKRLFWKVKK